MQEDKNMKIGSVTLDLSKYSGKDMYCDGDVEDRLLEIARDHSKVEFEKIIDESKSWPILYHLSPLRENIVDWIPIRKDMKILEVGAGCGAITGSLAERAGHVDCIDLSLKRSRINAYRHMDCDNIDLHVGNFTDIEPELGADYDYIMLIGVFEYGQAYIGGKDPYARFLKLLKKHLSPEGRIVIAIENRFGLKYWAGCREDHIGTYFGGIEGYADDSVVKTFSADTLKSIAAKCGFSMINMYYPYPDYKFMTDLYSDKRLPHRGELIDNIRNFDADRLDLFDEGKVYDSLIDENRFSDFSNSYLMILGPDVTVEYVRYGNDRSPEYSIRTEMIYDSGIRKVIKSPADASAASHIERMIENYRKLSDRYRGGKLEICECHAVDDNGVSGVAFDYIPGVPLSELMDECESRGDIEGFDRLFDEYIRRISYRDPKAQPVSDLDLIFPNIIVDGDKWTAIDYEWVKDEETPASAIAFRALMYYTKHEEKHEKLNLDDIISELGLTALQIQDIRDDEAKIQSRILGRRRKTMPALRDDIANRVYSLDYIQSLIDRENRRVGIEHVQVFEDSGSGFSEDDSRFYTPGENGRTDISVKIGRGLRAVRIDPCDSCCIVRISELTINGKMVDLEKSVTVNGAVHDGLFIFDTEDPNIIIDFAMQQGDTSVNITDESELHIVMDVSIITHDMAMTIIPRKGLMGRLADHRGKISW